MTQPPNPLAIVYTVDQFCAMMQHSRDKFEDLVRRGELAAFKVGRRTYVAKDEAERWLRETQNLKKVTLSKAQNPGPTPDCNADAQTPAHPPVLTAVLAGNRRHRAAKGKRQPIDDIGHAS